MKKVFLRLLFLLCILSIAPLPAVALEKGEPVPPIQGEAIDGETFDLSSLKGEPIILKVGTTWCGTCKAQAKAIQELNNFMKDHGVKFVDVFIQESGKRVKKYLDKNGYPLPDVVLLDGGDISGELNIYLIPRVILIDKDYKVFRDGSDLSSKQLQAELEEMLGG